MANQEHVGSGRFDAEAFIGRYFGYWNDGDVDAVAASFARGGVYRDPSSGEVSRDTLRAYIADLKRSFPDLTWVPSAPPGYIHDTGTIVCEWTMQGTHKGSLRGEPLGFPADLPPTGRKGSAHGVDIIRLDKDHRILRHDAYFDQFEIYQSLGLKAIVHPGEIDGAAVGWAVHLPADMPVSSPPTAFATTWIEPSSQADVATIVNTTRAIARETAKCPGFAGLTAAVFDHRMYTVSAWMTPEQALMSANGPAHEAAARRFLHGELGRSQHAAIFKVHTRGPLWLRDGTESAPKDVSGEERSEGVPWW